MLSKVGLIASVLAVAGCGGGGDVQCEEDMNCGLEAGGLCTVAPSGNQWCTYEDSTCESGRRWSDLDVGDGLSGECVGDSGGMPDGGPDIDTGIGVVDAATGSDGCTPTTCQAEGAMCGTISDGCGLMLNCGICPLTYATKLTAGLGGDDFGSAVSVSSGRAVVGASGDDSNGSNAGAAYVFERQISGTWIQVDKLLAPDGADSDYFGISVAISGDVVVVGSYWDDGTAGNNTGSAYVYERSPQGDWNYAQKLTATDGAGGDTFGNAVATDGTSIVVGALLHNVTQGAVYVYEKPSSSWQFVDKLEASDGAFGDFFGGSVAADDGRVVVGADMDDDTGGNSGSAYVYERAMNGTWNEVAKLNASDGAQNDNFGNAVAVSGDTIAVGVSRALGSTYVFSRDQNGGWDEDDILNASDGATDDGFGQSVAVDGDLVVVGSPHDDDNGDSSGSAYPFADDMGTWAQLSKLLAPDGTSNDDFGTVAARDGFVVVGAPGAGATGAAYVFEREEP